MADTTETFKRIVRLDLTPRLVEIRKVETITPGYLRITFGGDQLNGFQSLDPEDHFKLILPPPGEDGPVLPTIGPDGFRYADGVSRPVMRDYTPRRFDADAAELEVDFVIHGDGMASNWAVRAQPGQLAGVLGPRGSHIIADVFDWYLLIGDETVLPSIARRLEEARADARFLVFVEIDRPENQQEPDTKANADIRWLHRNGQLAGTTSLLEDAIREVDFPEGSVFVWAAGEATTLRAIRRHVITERGIAADHTSFSGHWKRGTADFDHHEPIE